MFDALTFWLRWREYKARWDVIATRIPSNGEYDVSILKLFFKFCFTARRSYFGSEIIDVEDIFYWACGKNSF